MKLYKCSNWGPFIYQFHDVISFINTKTMRRLVNSEIQVLKDRYVLKYNLKRFFKNSSSFRKLCLMVSSADNIARRNPKTGHCSISKYLDADGMIDCDFLIFKNCSHCINDPIPFLSIWFCSLNSILALKTKWTFILIERNIGVRYLKPVQIIGRQAETDYFMSWKICIIECISAIQDYGSDSIQIRNSSVDSEGVIMCH